MEAFLDFERAAEVKDGGTSIVVFERWMQTRDHALLAQIDEYNREDCIATLLLRDWLLELQARGDRAVRADPAGRSAEEPRPSRPRRRPSAPALQRQLARRRRGGRPAHLLDYHRREGKPVWWWFFERVEMTPEELLEDAESIGGLEPVGEPGAGDEALAGVHVHVPGAGAQARGRAGRASTRRRATRAGEIARARPRARGTLVLKRGPTLDGRAAAAAR